MHIIAELSVSKTDDRKRKITDLKRDFSASDGRLHNLIAGKRDELSKTMEMFSQISAKINTSRRGCSDVKEKLLACKKLLQCKREEIRRLWLESLEHKEIIKMMQEIEDLSKVNDKVKELLKEEKFSEATQLLVSSTELLDGRLCAAEALKDLSSELTTLKKTLSDVLVLEMLHKYLYKSPEHVFLRSDLPELPSYDDIFVIKPVKLKLPTEGCKYDFPNTNYDNIKEILHCISLLNTVPETVEVLKQNTSEQLSCIVRNSSEIMCKILSNTTYPHSNKNAENEPRHLLDLLEIILLQFRYVSINHYAFLDNLERICMKNNLKNVSRHEIAEIYSKIQASVEKFISQYMDLHNAGAQRAAAAFVKVTPTTAPTNVSSFFLRKGFPRSKKHSLFKFDASSHALSKKTYLLEQQGENNLPALEHSFLVCQPTAKNITIVYKSLKSFISEVEIALKMESGSHCPLHSFVNDCVKIYLDQVSMEVSRLMEQTKISLDAWQPVTNIEELKSVDAKTQILNSTLSLNSTLIEMEKLIYALPDYASHFVQMIFHVLMCYTDQCNSAYKSLIPQADSEEQTIFSVAWSRDNDISRLLRSLPNWTNLEIDLAGGDFEESPEEIRFRNKCESELLIRNLSTKDSISLSEIISDYNKLENLALMHESMEWFSAKVVSFADRLPDVQTSMLSLMPDKFSEESDGNIEFAVGMSTKATLKKLAKDFKDVADTCLLVLHLEVRAHCFYHLFQSSYIDTSKQGSYISRKDDEEPEPAIVKLNSDLSKIDESLSPVLQPKKIRYVFEGLGELLSTIMIKSVGDIKKINENGVKKMGRNIFAIQQNLAGITMTREVALDRARQYFDLLNHTYEDILNQIVEEGPLFQEHEYSAVIQLLHKSREGIYDQDSLSSYLEKLRQILDEVAVSV
ncbi:hypothetical protein JTE90_020682 [Oedothorax gibbosus]|uniref:Exocyst complex component Sec8 n=1 Tax=Oedothorax gibbosus TaxID=931172 RepID=A0AAV6V457_9ARAC|nr:hypothetical protein JTE90_020682 [Oedothorax gibbosus]